MVNHWYIMITRNSDSHSDEATPETRDSRLSSPRFQEEGGKCNRHSKGQQQKYLHDAKDAKDFFANLAMW